MNGEHLADVYAGQGSNFQQAIRNSFLLTSILEDMLAKDYKLIAEDTVKREHL